MGVKYDCEIFNPGEYDDNNIDKMQISMIPEGSRVLEIGCATGFMSEYLVKTKKCFVFGVESRKEEAEAAGARCDKIICGRIDSPGVEDELDAYCEKSGGFDVVFMSQVIEHIAFPEDVLLKIKNWLSDSGSLVVSSCNVAYWESRFRLLAGIWEYEEFGIFDNTHLRFFTVISFRKMLERCGYRIVDEKFHLNDIDLIWFIPPLRRFVADRFSLRPSTMLGLLPLVGRGLRKRYINRFKNLIAFQFVYKAEKG
ncbi:MAG: class I SAM-dependent methyltransferase [bacterium]